MHFFILQEIFFFFETSKILICAVKAEILNEKWLYFYKEIMKSITLVF